MVHINAIIHVMSLTNKGLFPLGLSNTQKSRVAASPVSVSTISLRRRRIDCESEVQLQVET